MNPIEEIALLEELLDELLRGIQDVLQSGEVLSDEFQGLLAQELEATTSRIDQLRQESSQPPEPPGAPPIEPQRGLGPAPAGEIQLLWILAGQNEDAFIQYLTTYPSQITQSLLANPDELQRNISFLQQMMPGGQPPAMADGIPHADLNSSNIYGFRYNPENQKLKVRFQSGSVYEYDNVPMNLFNAFRNGSAAAKTSGQNQFGRWWVGKNPSLGAAFWNYIRNAGFNYRRLR